MYSISWDSGKDEINIIIPIRVIIIIMSDFAFMRFMSNNLLTTEEAQHKDEIIDLTEEVLHARGLECDDRISKLSEQKLKEILEEVRKLRRRRRTTYHNVSDNDSREKEELLYIK
ncbi:MAG: hypothetical protein JO327_04130 [Nitrososphaeraceae archaeon]|nr:hypothetical protein [Nitrososphaeraceae archaeon]MBV9667299.1 hypothetical protein [Nitrososphaeraceae archaeon]